MPEWTRSQAKGLFLAPMLALIVSLCLPLPRHGDAPLISRIPMRVNGPLLVTAVQRGTNSASETILAVGPGQASRSLVSNLPAGTGIGASPRGRYIALAEGERGLWLVKTNGTGLYRRLLPPSPTQHVYPLTISAVAWSPDHYTLAYVVDEDLSSATGPGQPAYAADAHIGVWIARYDGGAARQVATDTRLGDALFSLSWASDGRRIAVVGNGVTQIVDVAAGRAHLGVEGVGAFLPTSPVLAYTGDACDHSDSNGGNAFCVVNEQGNHQRVVGHDTAQGSSPGNVVWSPDGHTV